MDFSDNDQPISVHEGDHDEWSDAPRDPELLHEAPVKKDAGRHTVVHACPVDHSGMTVYVKGWLTTEPKRLSSVIIIHDIGESIGAYREFARRLSDRGHNVYAFDLRGHGRSGRMLGHINQFSDLVSDLLQVTAWIRHQEDGELPLIIGQGLGGLIALNFSHRFPKFCRGVTLASPCWKLRKPVSAFRRMVVRSIAELLPTVRLSSALVPRLAADSPAERFSIIGPIRGSTPFRITARFVSELLNAMETASSTVVRTDIPTQLLLPSNDPIYDYSAISTQFASEFAGTETEALLTTVDYDFAGHRLLSTGSEQLMRAVEDIDSWLRGISSGQSEVTAPAAGDRE